MLLLTLRVNINWGDLARLGVNAPIADGAAGNFQLGLRGFVWVNVLGLPLDLVSTPVFNHQHVDS